MDTARTWWLIDAKAYVLVVKTRLTCMESSTIVSLADEAAEFGPRGAFDLAVRKLLQRHSGARSNFTSTSSSLYDIAQSKYMHSSRLHHQGRVLDPCRGDAALDVSKMISSNSLQKEHGKVRSLTARTVIFQSVQSISRVRVPCPAPIPPSDTPRSAPLSRVSCLKAELALSRSSSRCLRCCKVDTWLRMSLRC